MNTALIGLQWGDEGKGKISHYLSSEFDVFVRFQGGGNAGHTIYHNGDKVVTHFLPVGIVHKDKICVLGNGMVINPDALVEEIMDVATLLGEAVSEVAKRVYISNKAHVVTPRALQLDSEREKTQKLGTTKTGIGPTYESKINRTGLTVGSIPEGERYSSFLWLFEGRIVNTEILLSRLDGQGKSIFFEGAQGVLLDVDLGQYPFVTSSNCVPSAIGTGAGFPVSKVDRIIGVTKPYSTRVGAGPFTSEMSDEDDERFRHLGAEFGATTGRPRKCGWLDVFALKYAVEVAGVTEIAIAKMDILNGLSEVPVCVGYEIDGKQIRDTLLFPYGEEWASAKPIYDMWPGWSSEQDSSEFLEMLSSFVGVPVKHLSYGPGPEATHSWD